jgi:hypothetical protein
MDFYLQTKEMEWTNLIEWRDLLNGMDAWDIRQTHPSNYQLITQMDWRSEGKRNLACTRNIWHAWSESRCQMTMIQMRSRKQFLHRWLRFEHSHHQSRDYIRIFMGVGSAMVCWYCRAPNHEPTNSCAQRQWSTYSGALSLVSMHFKQWRQFTIALLPVSTWAATLSGIYQLVTGYIMCTKWCDLTQNYPSTGLSQVQHEVKWIEFSPGANLNCFEKVHISDSRSNYILQSTIQPACYMKRSPGRFWLFCWNGVKPTWKTIRVTGVIE